MSAQKIDVLAAMSHAATELQGMSPPMRQRAQDLREARAAVAELIEAAKMANGDHSAPHDCYATGPLTGDVFLDLVACPGCRLSAALARIGGAA